MRLVPPALLDAPAPLDVRPDGLTSTTRAEILLAPLVTKTRYARGLAAHAFIGVWDADGPVPEATDWMLGRQEYQFLQERPLSSRRIPHAIYLGVPRSSWGHFLTQSLARVWYALDHPEIPVVWHARRLQDYQREVLEAIGLRNEQHFVGEPLEVDEMVFPQQGICIGEFATPAFADAVGRYRGPGTVPGRRVFLSRSGLDQGRGSLEDDGDHRLDEIFARHGFDIVHPEGLSVVEQLDWLSSAEVVVGVEGSALHTVLLLQGPVRARFLALTRHRGGSGVYAHIKHAKALDYETLDFTTRHARGAGDALALDLAALDAALGATAGFTTDLDALAGVTERPLLFETALAGHLANVQVRPDPREAHVLDAYLGLRRSHTDVESFVQAMESLL